MSCNLVVTAPLMVGREDFEEAWRERSFDGANGFLDAWKTYIKETMKAYDIPDYFERDFDVLQVNEVCEMLNDSSESCNERWYAAVKIG